jgi:hypothetical protein
MSGERDYHAFAADGLGAFNGRFEEFPVADVDAVKDADGYRGLFFLRRHTAEVGIDFHFSFLSL